MGSWQTVQLSKGHAAFLLRTAPRPQPHKLDRFSADIEYFFDRSDTLQIENRKRDGVGFNLAIDSKRHGYGVVAIRVDDIAPNGYAMDPATVRQKKTGRPVRFEPAD